MCAREGCAFDPRGLNTAYELYRVEIAAYRVQGQDFETTNGQRGVALSSRGRPRGRRAIQYNRKRLVAMGLVAYEHIKRGGWRAGQRDTLRVRMCPPPARRNANCTPPSGATTLPPGGSVVACRKEIPPAAPADESPPAEPAAPGPPIDFRPRSKQQKAAEKEEDRQRQLRFDALWKAAMAPGARGGGDRASP